MPPGPDAHTADEHTAELAQEDDLRDLERGQRL